MNCSEFVQGATTEGLQRRDSPPMTHSQRATRSPLVRSPVASTWRSSLGLLARVAASKRGRSPSTRIASSPLEERANSSTRSPSILGPPSPVTTPFGGSKINHPHVRKTRRLTSAVWRDFKPIYRHKILVKAQCKHCHEVFQAGRDVGTSGVRRHLAACEKRNTIKDECMKHYNLERSAFFGHLKKYNGRVSLTADMWTSNQTLSYLCITCHLINNKWILQKRIFRFFMVETPHNGVTMFNVLLKSLQECNIEDKLFSMTLDNASVTGTMVNNLRKNLNSKHMLPIKGQLLHIRCACHVINLIVQDGLTTMKGVIDDIRESVKYIKSSPSRLDKFKEVVAQVGISCKLPSADVPTRWNSTYIMLESALPFRRAFRALVQKDPDYVFCPSSREWKNVDTVCVMLKVFHTATNVLSGSSYSTSNLYFHQIWNVRLLLQKEASTKDEVVQAMVGEMQKKFDKYWMESYLPNCIPVILDPRFKLCFIEFRLKQAFGPDVERHLLAVKEVLDNLFEEYSSQMTDALDESAPRQNFDEVVNEENYPLADWDQHLNKKQCQTASELARYLEEDTFTRTEDFNILQWWHLHSSKYPILSCIARDVLAVQASVVSS
ncbi:zinc finger BED domain-containing protein RICESLEEPER 2 isoform X1 [Triticum aestivum]|uniref:zinc finger BED domain-containing protein RICESLEEPER 2 isoform X1 n=1 Tax=Triticum aestivum TaxID=4565 RepID=UPI001D004718|nr:zinc finger BED domain-containing protein RICESLEEPER 2-like isoform X1 [Triticum aestivum]